MPKKINRLFFLATLLLSGCATEFSVQSSISGMGAKYGELAKHEEAQIQERGETAASLYNLCNSYLNMRAFDKVTPCLDRMEQRIRQGDNRIVFPNQVGATDGTAPLYTMRAETALELGHYDEAFRFAEKGYEAAKTMDNSFLGHEQSMHTIAALELMTLAKVFGGDVPQAEVYYRTLENHSFGMRGMGIVSPRRSTALGRMNMALGRYDQALDVIANGSAGVWIGMGKVITLGGFGALSYYEVPFKFMHAKALMETGKSEQAKPIYDDLLDHAHIKDNSSLHWMILFDRGRIAEKEGELKAAIDYYRQAVEVIERQRATINTEASKIGFVGNKQAVYRQLIAALHTDRQYVAAFEYVERSKARALVDMLAAKQDFAVSSGDPARVKNLLAMARRNETESPIRDPASDKSQTRNLAVSVRQQLDTESPELASLVNVSSLTAAQIQALIPADETLIEYYYDAPDLIAFVLTAQGLSAVRLDARGLLDNVREFRKQLESGVSAGHGELSRRLHSQLIAPLAGHIRAGKLIVVAHGPLHYLPFNALHDGQRYLIERYSLRMLPSASVLKYLRSQPAAKPGNVLAFGNPDLGDPRFDLVHAQAEAIAVTRNRPESRVLLRKEANETAFRQYGGSFRYIHFATHGAFDADAPLKSALLLAKDAESDGMLTVDKLYSLRLDADLVTLSACETGLGKIANGDDVVGLTRGFLYAGSRSIVASLWKVDDLATSYLMTRFYDNLGGGDKREALRRAQLDTLKKYPHPFYWAAFQLTGNAN